MHLVVSDPAEDGYKETVLLLAWMERLEGGRRDREMRNPSLLSPSKSSNNR
jgi:hypothetical protein